MKFWNLAVSTAVALSMVVVGCGRAPETVSTEPADAPAQAEPAQPAQAPTPDAQVAALEAMCAEAQPAMTARQAADSLYNRVGGRDGLHIVVADTVRRHLVNEPIKHLFADVDTDHVVESVTDFLVVGTGGEGEYHGRDMVSVHAPLHLDNAHFLAAGADLGAAMTEAGWGDEEQQELLCAFVGLRPMVVEPAADAG